MRTIRDCPRIHATGAIKPELRRRYRILLFAAILGGPTNAHPDESASTQEVADDSDQAIVHWNQVGEAQWHWTGGEVSVMPGGPDGMLITSQRFQDFRLRIEFKPDAKVNSGVFIRCQDVDDITPFTCYEINIWDNHPNQDFRTGAIVARAFPPLAHLDSASEWNVYEITAQGDTITVLLNGVKTSELKDATHASGFIALQRAQGGEIRFRNISIEPNYE